jgi:CheY-like chemotaxis protein
MNFEPRIIVVEDHPLHARLVTRALATRLSGSEIELFADGQEAACRIFDASRPKPDLLVLDLRIRGRTGHDLLAERARDARLRDVPAVIVTSSRADADRERSLELGATLHLHKPTDADGFRRLADQLATLLEQGPEADAQPAPDGE